MNRKRVILTKDGIFHRPSASPCIYYLCLGEKVLYPFSTKKKNHIFPIKSEHSRYFPNISTILGRLVSEIRKIFAEVLSPFQKCQPLPILIFLLALSLQNLQIVGAEVQWYWFLLLLFLFFRPIFFSFLSIFNRNFWMDSVAHLRHLSCILFRWQFISHFEAEKWGLWEGGCGCEIYEFFSRDTSVVENGKINFFLGYAEKKPCLLRIWVSNEPKIIENLKNLSICTCELLSKKLQNLKCRNDCI